MPFVVDYSSNSAFAGQNAGAFAEQFTGAINKQALTDAAVARSEAATAQQKLETMQARARDKSAQDLAALDIEWQGPDKGFAKRATTKSGPLPPGGVAGYAAGENDGSDMYAGVDAAGNRSELDNIRRRKMRAFAEIAKGLPSDMLQPFMAMRERELQEEIVQSQRESIQDQLGDLAGRLANTPGGLDKIYGPEIEAALKALDDPNSDPLKAEAVYNKMQGIVQKAVVEQQQYENALATVGGIIGEVSAQGGDVGPYAELYGGLLSGQYTPEEARTQALRTKFNMGPRTWTDPTSGRTFPMNSNLWKGGNADSIDSASAEEALTFGRVLAFEDPSLGSMPTAAEVDALAAKYAVSVMKAHHWVFPPGYEQGFAGKDKENADKRSRTEARREAIDYLRTAKATDENGNSRNLTSDEIEQQLPSMIRLFTDVPAGQSPPTGPHGAPGSPGSSRFNTPSSMPTTNAKASLDAAPKPKGASKASGMVEKATIDATQDFKPLKNADGSTSTIRTMSFEEDGKEVLVPTVVEGKQLSDDEAIALYRKTGKHFGKYGSVDAANAEAERLHKGEEAKGGPRSMAGLRKRGKRESPEQFRDYVRRAVGQRGGTAKDVARILEESGLTPGDFGAFKAKAPNQAGRR